MRTTAAHMLKQVAVASDRVRKPARGVVVLIYHRVGGGSGLELDLPRTMFADQLTRLAASGRVMSLDAALDVLALPEAPPIDPVVISFDDGTRDFVDVTVPLLVEHQIPAMLYVATSFVDEQRDFPYGAPPASWSGLTDAYSTGLVTLGSHTHSHVLLDRLAPHEVANELDTADRLIAEHTGVSPRHFAYPKALAGSPAAERAVRSRYRSAALAGTRANVVGATDPYRLARSPVQASDAGKYFEAKLRGGMSLEDSFRRGLNRVRYSGAQQ